MDRGSAISRYKIRKGYKGRGSTWVKMSCPVCEIDQFGHNHVNAHPHLKLSDECTCDDIVEHLGTIDFDESETRKSFVDDGDSDSVIDPDSDGGGDDSDSDDGSGGKKKNDNDLTEAQLLAKAIDGKKLKLTTTGLDTTGKVDILRNVANALARKYKFADWDAARTAIRNLPGIEPAYLTIKMDDRVTKGQGYLDIINAINHNKGLLNLKK